MNKIWHHPFFILFVINIFIYAQALTFTPFIFDDGFHIFGNTLMKGPFIEGIVYYLKNSLTPLPFLWWRTLSLITADSTILFRLGNILFHTLNGFLLFRLANIIWSEKSESSVLKAMPWLITFFYLLHPVQVEAVVWISSLRTLMATSFALLSVNSLIRNELSEVDDNRSPWQKHALTLLFYFMALLSNPTTAPSFMLGLILVFLIKKKISSNLLKISGILFLIAVIIFFGHEREILTTYYGDLSFMLRFKITVVAISTYLINLVFPFKLTFDYQVNPLSISYLEETSQLFALLMISPLALLTLATLWIKGKTRRLALLLSAFFICLLPHIGFILHDFNNISVVSDRYLNFPLIPFSLFFGIVITILFDWAQKNFQKMSPWLPITFVAVLLPALSVVQLYKWKDPKTLLKSSQNLLELREPILVALGNLYAQDENFRMARASFKEALAATPNSISALLGLVQLNEQNHSKESDQFIVEYLFNNPIAPTRDAIIPLARLYLREHQFKLALNLVNQGLLLKITEKERQQMMNLRNEIAKFKEEFAVKALKDLESFYSSQGNYKRAIEYLKELKKIDPFKRDYYQERLQNYQSESIKIRKDLNN